MYGEHDRASVLDRRGGPLKIGDYVRTSYKDHATGYPILHRIEGLFPNGFRALRCPAVLYESGGYDPAELVTRDDHATYEARYGSPLQTRDEAVIEVPAIRVWNGCCGYGYYLSPDIDPERISLECPRCGSRLRLFELR